MVLIKINSIEFDIRSEISVLEACEMAGFQIPRFCYHEILSISGNCRMCLVELEDIEKPIASCVTEVEDNMKIWLDSPFVKKARENVLELLLLNHPLDCPICDQAGECDLQDQTKGFNSDYSRFFFKKRGVEDKYLSVLIKTIMTRCIHCTRCIRYAEEIAGIEVLGTLKRGVTTEIGNYVNTIFNSEISGNVIDLCPVGALTSKPYAYRSRPWELRFLESIDLTDSLGSSIYVNFKETEIYRILPKNNNQLNYNLISDKARYSYDALKTNRIQSAFKFNQLENKFNKISWDNVLEDSDILLKSKKIKILINNEISLEDAITLKTIMKTQKKVNVYNIEHKIYKNFYYNNKILLMNTLKLKIDACFLLSTNLKLENTILNFKIRHKYMRDTFKIYGLGYNLLSNFNYNYINFNINKIICFFEGKDKELSRILNNSINPLLIIGKSFNNRLNTFTELVFLLQDFIPQICILNMYFWCNEKGIELIHFKTFAKKKQQNEFNFFVNLEDNIFIRKIIPKSKNWINFWLNSYGSKQAIGFRYVLPTLTSFEYEGYYINLEGKIQKTTKFITTFFEARKVKDFLICLFNIKINAINNSFNYFYEVINNLKNFENACIEAKILKLNTSNEYITLFSTYPCKSSVLDYYCTNSITKNSTLMLENSKQSRKYFTNF